MVPEQRTETSASTDLRGTLDEIVARFEAAWEKGEPEISSFLPESESLRLPVLLSLVEHDLKSRLRAGQAIRVENYLEGFPELARDHAVIVHLLGAEYTLRGECVSIDEYRERFPGLWEEFRARLDMAESTLPSAPPPAQGGAAAGNPNGALPVRYRVIRPHARGGLGEVFVALDQELHREVALKEIQAEYARDPRNRSRFLLEAEITGNLEHPGIVPVYGLGHYSDGRPFYAMRFIKGDNLKEAVKHYHAGPANDPRQRRFGLRQLLGRFIDVCNAMGYAHSRGVLHRDLKPGNIMLGKYGETLVVDWGLAKPVGSRPESAPADESTIRVQAAGGDDSATQIGSAVGTPAYMSPEQARGRHDLLGPASDIYSLGATLYTLLTGLPPFQHADFREVLRRVEEGKVTPPRRVNKKIPAALDAICLKAMAREPEDRYASALDLAADVEHWLADEPVSAYREPLPARLGRWARRHRAWVAGAAALLIASVVALSVSTVLIGLEKAETEEARREAEANFWQATHEKERAEAQTKEARRQKKFAEDNAAEAEKQKHIAEKHAIEAGKQKALALQQKALAEEQTERAQANFAMARAAVDQMLTEVSQRWLMDLPFMEPVRRKILQRAVTFYQGFLKEKSDDPDVREAAGRAFMRLADIYQHLGKQKEAGEAYAEARMLFKKLTEDFPDNPEHRMDLSLAHNNIGILLAGTGKQKEALAEYQQALAIQKKLVEDFPGNDEFEQALGHSYNNVGIRLYALRRDKEAAESFEAAFKIAKDLAARFPDRPGYQQDLAHNYSRLGLHLANDNKNKEALDAYRQAKDILDKLVAKYVRSDYRLELAHAYHQMGIQLALTGQTDEAYEAYRQALMLRKRLVADYPSRPDYRQALAGNYYIIGIRLSKSGKKQEAADSYREAVKLGTRLVTEFPTRPDYQIELARACNNLAFLLEDMQYKTAALELHQQAVALRRKLAQDFPERMDYRNLLGIALRNLAFLLRDLREYRDARQLLEEALEQHRASVKGLKNDKYVRDLRISGTHLCDTLEALKDHAALAKTAADMLQVAPAEWQDYHRAARFLATCIPLADADTTLTDERRKQLTQEYGDRSLAFLQHAVQKGFRNVQLLQNDPRFDPVRTRADFKNLIAKLEKANS